MLPSLSLKVVHFLYSKFIQEKNTLHHIVLNVVARLDRDTCVTYQDFHQSQTLYCDCVCNIYTFNCVTNIG